MVKETKNPDAVVAAPFGHLGLWVGDGGLYCLDLLPEKKIISISAEPLIQKVIDQLQSYFEDSSFPLNIELHEYGTSFQQAVWARLRKIPAGKTIYYGELAQEMNTSPRAVGGACRANPIPVFTPCHRVTSRNSIGGYMGQVSGPALEMKKWLVGHEQKS